MLLVALLFSTCQNIDLYNKLACPGCVTSIQAPCTDCRIFVSGTTQGNMTSTSCAAPTVGIAVCGQGANGIQKADYICQNDPSRPAGTRRWKALIVDGLNRTACTNTNCASGTAGRIDWVLWPNTKYFKPDGVTLVMTTDVNGVFIFGTLTNFINNAVAYSAWTGINGDWTTSTAHCTQWTDNTLITGSYGTSSLNDSQSIAANTITCNTNNNLYCVEQ